MKMAELLPLRVYPFTLEIPELSMSQKKQKLQDRGIMASENEYS